MLVEALHHQRRTQWIYEKGSLWKEGLGLYVERYDEILSNILCHTAAGHVCHLFERVGPQRTAETETFPKDLAGTRLPPWYLDPNPCTALLTS